MQLSLKVGIKLVVTGLLVWWLVGHVDWRAVGHMLAQVSLPLVALYCLLQLIGNLLSAWKWRFIAEKGGFRFSLKDGFFSYLSGAFINNFLPSTIGGDAYRTMWMSSPGKRFEAFMVVFFDRLSGLLALFLSAAVGLFLLPWHTFLTDPVLFVVGAITLSMALFILVSLFWFTGLFEVGLLILDWFPPLVKVKRAVERFRPLIEMDLYLQSLIFSLLFLGIGVGLSNYALWLSLGATLPLSTFLGCVFLATLIANLPLSINNLGIKEWAYILIFGLVGVSAELAVTAALLSRLLQMLLSFVALPWYMQRERYAPKTLSR